ncbi:metallophosphoesterase [Actinoplanes sp. NBC_00393]|uniref:metallophosphoesterase n=1 Tax=Actinoplanes sp. NBC_00393 TaxID=2975953 RepID=UPI002E23B3E3
MITILILIVVAVLVFAAFAAGHWYAWRRVVRDTTARRSTLRRVGTAVFIAGPVLGLAAIRDDMPGIPFAFEGVIDWPGFMWLALFLYLVLALAVGELLRPLLRWWLARRDTGTTEPAGQPGGKPAAGDLVAAVPPADPDQESVVAVAPQTDHEPDGPAAQALSRRVFVSRVVGGAAAAAALGTVGYGTYGVMRGPQVKRLTVPLAKLPRTAHGFRIAVVSDIHLGPILGRRFTQRVVDTINSTQPDLIAVVGDLVDGSVEDLASAVEPLTQLSARHGSYFVTGNHEYFNEPAEWIDKIRELGLRPLENARTELPGFDLAGVNDVQGEQSGQGPDFAKALGDRDRTRTAVLLAHQPVVIDDAVTHGVDLQLSGHTHGGQLWPGPLLAGLANPTVAGLERYGDTQLYVSRGAGVWGPPVRVGAPSDITVVELASAQA